MSSGWDAAQIDAANAPDPHRPRVRIVMNKEGTRLDLPHDRNLWEPTRDGEQTSILAPVEPSKYGIDPLNYLQN